MGLDFSKLPLPKTLLVTTLPTSRYYRWPWMSKILLQLLLLLLLLTSRCFEEG